MHESLLTFTPKPAKYETLGEFSKKVEKELKTKTESGINTNVFQTAYQLLETSKKTIKGKQKGQQKSIEDFFTRKDDNNSVSMGDKKKSDLKTLFGDGFGEEEEDDDFDRLEKKRKHEDSKKKHEKYEKKQKLGESSMDQEYEKFVEAVEHSGSNSEDNKEKKNEQNGGSSHKNHKTKHRLKKTEIGNLVVKLLTPAYVEKRFESRETFKSTARNISHSLLDKGKIFSNFIF